MKLLSVYIARSVLISILLVLGVVLVLDFTGDFFYRLGRAAENAHALRIILGIVLELPQKMLEFLPSAFLVGGVFGLGRMVVNSEFVVILASGYSRMDVMKSLLMTGLVVALFVLTVHEVLGPLAVAKSNKLESSELSENLLLAADQSVWFRRPGQFIRIGEVVSDRLLMDVTIYTFDELFRLNTIRRAERAIKKESGWRLYDETLTVLDMESIQTRMSQSSSWPGFELSQAIHYATAQPQQLSMRELRSHIADLHANDLDDYPYRLALYTRYAFLFTALVLLALCLPFVITGRRAGDMGLRITLAILLSFLLYTLSNSLSTAGSVYRLSPLLLAFVPGVIILLVTTILMRFQR